MELWLKRLFRLFPGLRFEVIDVIVNGWHGHAAGNIPEFRGTLGCPYTRDRKEWPDIRRVAVKPMVCGCSKISRQTI
jgi:hypothetical protein